MLNIHKNEIVFTLDGGWNAVVNMILLFENLGKFSYEQDKVLPKVSFKEGEMPKLIGMMNDKSIFTFMEVDSYGKGMNTGMGLRLPP